MTNALGGSRHILNCGQPVTDVGYVSSLAWLYHVDVGSVGGLQQHVEAAELANPAVPKVMLQTGVPGRVGRQAVAHAPLPGGPLRRAERDLHEQRRADPPLSERGDDRAEAESESGAGPAPAGAGRRGAAWACGRRAPVLVTLVARGRSAGRLAADPAVGADPAGVRSVRLARVGSSDGGREPRHERRPVVEAAAVSVHGPVRAVRPLPAVAVDGHLAGGVARRRGVRRADRVSADAGRATPGGATPAWVAAAFAAAAYFGISTYWHYMLSAQSDPMIVTLCLAAIDCHLCGRYRWAFALGALAALGRPEVWLFLGLYSIWAWLRVPSMRWLIVVELVLVVLLWFGIPALTSRTPVRGRLERARLGAPAAQRPGVRHDRPVPRPEHRRAVADRAAGGGARFRASRPRDARARGGGVRLGDRRDRVRAPRLARARALHVRAGRGVVVALAGRGGRAAC